MTKNSEQLGLSPNEEMYRQAVYNAARAQFEANPHELDLDGFEGEWYGNTIVFISEPMDADVCMCVGANQYAVLTETGYGWLPYTGDFHGTDEELRVVTYNSYTYDDCLRQLDGIAKALAEIGVEIPLPTRVIIPSNTEHEEICCPFLIEELTS